MPDYRQIIWPTHLTAQSSPWDGGTELTATRETRNNYLAALKRADAGDFIPLIRFARS